MGPLFFIFSLSDQYIPVLYSQNWLHITCIYARHCCGVSCGEKGPNQVYCTTAGRNTLKEVCLLACQTTDLLPGPLLHFQTTYLGSMNIVLGLAIIPLSTTFTNSVCRPSALLPKFSWSRVTVRSQCRFSPGLVQLTDKCSAIGSIREPF